MKIFNKECLASTVMLGCLVSQTFGATEFAENQEGSRIASRRGTASASAALSDDSSGRLQESSVASAASARSSVEEAVQDSTVRATVTATPSTVEKVTLHDNEFYYAEIYRVYKRKRNAGEDMFKSMSAAVPYDDRFKNRFVDVPRPMPEGYGSLSHKSESYNKERSMLRQKLEYDYLGQAGDQDYVGITTENNRGVKTTKKHFIKYAYEIYKFERESDRENFTQDVPFLTLLRLLGVNSWELCDETQEQGQALRDKLKKRYLDSGDYVKYVTKYGPGGRF